MKQGVLITAYKDFEQLLDLVQSFDDRFVIYIHIDKKSELTKIMRQKLMAVPWVKYLSRRYVVNWGGRNHLLSILHLIEQGLREPQIGYFHLITGEDYPVKPLDVFITFFEKNRGTEFLEHFTMPAACWKNGGMDRILYYNLYDMFNAQKHHAIIYKIRKLQVRIGFKRSLSKKLPKLYGGSTYWSLSRKALLEVVNYTKQNSYLLKRLKFTFCSEEIYIPTIIMNSSISNKVVSDNLRFIVWEEGASSPAYLQDKHLEELVHSNAFFARKFTSGTSRYLLNKLTDQRSIKQSPDI